MKNNQKTNFIISLSLLLVVLMGGVIAFLLFWQNFSNNFFLSNRDINLNSPEYLNSSFVIQDPRKVYISQDLKVDESFNYLEESVLGLFIKNKKEGENYFIEDELISGIIISSDGWVLMNVLGLNNTLKNKDDYILISKKDKKLFEIEELIYSEKKDLLFLKIKNPVNFSVRGFVNKTDLSLGQSLLAYNFSSQVSVNYLEKIDSGKIIKNSDNFFNYITLSSPLSEDFKNSFIFNLNGDLLALVDSDLKIKLVHDFRPHIYSLLRNKEIKDFDLGVYYADLKDVLNKDFPNNGAWIYNNNLPAITKGSLADFAGLKSGDIIIKVNNYELGPKISLGDALNNFVWGDKINLTVLRDGEMKDFKIDLR